MRSTKPLIPRFLSPALIALFVAATGLGVTACSSPSGVDSDNGAEPAALREGKFREVELRDDMRQLWEQHVVWTRVFLIDALGGLPDLGAATARLLQNQVDIGDAIRPFYGDAAGDQLTSLLHDHITIAAEVVTAAKAGDTVKLAEANTRWYANADEIAAFLAAANPNWPLVDLEAMMREHLDATLAEAVARLDGDTAAEIVAYGQVRHHILEMADALTAGIVAQFPKRVSPSRRGVKGQELHLAMRELWVDHVSWTRFFLIEAIAGLPATAATAGRLLQNQSDIGNAIKPFYGDAAGDRLAALLHDHITIAAEIVGDAMSGDGVAVADAKLRWYANADEIAQFLAAANPNWELDELEMMMRQHLDRTLVEATARLTQDWNADIAAYDAIEADILDMADMLSRGITEQFSD